MYVTAQFCNFYILPFTPVISEVSVTLNIWGCQGLFLINDKSVIYCITWHVILRTQSVTAFSQPAKVTMVALMVEGSESCRWHVVSQECHICGTSPELEGYTPMHDIFKAVILWIAAVKTVKYEAMALNSECLVIPDGNGSVLITVFGQKWESSISEAWPKARE